MIIFFFIWRYTHRFYTRVILLIHFWSVFKLYIILLFSLLLFETEYLERCYLLIKTSIWWTFSNNARHGYFTRQLLYLAFNRWIWSLFWFFHLIIDKRYRLFIYLKLSYTFFNILIYPWSVIIQIIFLSKLSLLFLYWLWTFASISIISCLILPNFILKCFVQISWRGCLFHIWFRWLIGVKRSLSFQQRFSLFMVRIFIANVLDI